MSTSLKPINSLVNSTRFRAPSDHNRAGVTLLEDKTDCFEPKDGIIAVPPPKGAPRYNMTKLFDYCDSVNKEPKDLTEKEKKWFEITRR
jgi:hypothetical protein